MNYKVKQTILKKEADVDTDRTELPHHQQYLFVRSLASGAQRWSLGGLAAVLMEFGVPLTKDNRDSVSCICSLPHENTVKRRQSINLVEGSHKRLSIRVPDLKVSASRTIESKSNV